MAGFWKDIGPAQYWWDKTATPAGEIGPTFGGSRWRLKVSSASVMQDITGVEPVDKIFTGSIFEAEANFTTLPLEKLALLIPGAELGTGTTSKSLSLKSPVGMSMKDNAKPLIIKPIIGSAVSTDETLWIEADLAYPEPDFELVATVEDQRVYKTLWTCFRNGSGVAAKFGKDVSSGG